ncbi:monocarboxylate transporter 12-like isoform X2 [Acanthaster planci]|nr:monocarboxylate transporter 12-like isoform X2 [Acanthaster planci]
MFGTRTVVTVSGFLVGMSMIVASFTTKPVVFTLTLSLVAGPTIIFVNILTRALIGRCFPTNYGTANAIGTSGASVGLITAGPFVQLLLNTYGWRGTLLLMGGLSLHLGVCGATLRSLSTETQTKGNYQLLRADTNEEIRASAKNTDNSIQSQFGAFKDAIGAQLKHFGFSVCGRVSFWITGVVFTCSHFAADLWYIYYVSQAEVKGFSPDDAVTFTAAAGFGSLVCRITCGLIVDRGWLKLRCAMVLTIITSSITLLVTPWINTYWPMMVNAFLFFGSSGTLFTLNDLYTRELLGVDLLASAFSWMELLAAVFSFSLGFVPGWMYDQTGSYDWAFFILGCISTLPLVALMLEWFLEKLKS